MSPEPPRLKAESSPARSGRRGLSAPLLLLLAPGLALIAAIHPQVADAQEEPKAARAFVMDAEVAFGGYYKPGLFATTHVEMENRGPDRRVEVSARSTTSTRVLQVDLASGGRKRLQLSMPVPRYGGWTVVARDIDTGEQLGKVTPSVSSLYDSARLVAFVDKRPPGLKEDLLKDLDGDGSMDFDFERAGARIARTSPDMLPETWLGYHPLSALIWLHPRLDKLSPAQFEALESWLVRGGHLVVAMDEGWKAVAGSRLGPLLPAEVTGLVGIDSPSSIGALLGPGVSFGSANPEGLVDLPQRLMVLAAKPRPGAHPGPESSNADDPLTWSWSYGDGRVTLWRASPERTGRTPELQHWESWLLDRAGGLDRQKAWDVVHEDEPKLDINIIGLLLVLTLYILIIGPVDYLVLRKLRRLEWTSFTYPATIALFSALAWLAMSQSVDSGSFEARFGVVTWHLPGEAIRSNAPRFNPERTFTPEPDGQAPDDDVDEPDPQRPDGVEAAKGGGASPDGAQASPRPAGGVLDLFVLDGFFPTTRQRMTLSPSRPGEDVWLGGRRYDMTTMATISQTLVGQGPDVEVVAPAYAMMPIESTSMLRDARVPVRLEIVEEEPEGGGMALTITIMNLLDVPLRRCWLRSGSLWTSEKLFDVPGGGRSVQELTYARSIDEVLEGWEIEENVVRHSINALPSFGLGSMRGDLTCQVDVEAAMGVKIPRRGAESEVTRGLVRFVF